MRSIPDLAILLHLLLDLCLDDFLGENPAFKKVSMIAFKGVQGIVQR
jgi:hypothetical protein